MWIAKKHSSNISLKKKKESKILIFQEALDNLQLKIVEAKQQWYNNTTTIHGKAKQVLLEFGLNPLHI